MKSDGVKRNHENMKINDGIPSHHGKGNEGTCFFCDSLNKNIPKKKIARLNNEESIHFEVFSKTNTSKTNKSSQQEVLPKMGLLKIQTSHNGLYKIYTESLRIL